MLMTVSKTTFAYALNLPLEHKCNVITLASRVGSTDADCTMAAPFSPHYPSERLSSTTYSGFSLFPCSGCNRWQFCVTYANPLRTSYCIKYLSEDVGVASAILHLCAVQFLEIKAECVAFVRSSVHSLRSSTSSK